MINLQTLMHINEELPQCKQFYEIVHAIMKQIIDKKDPTITHNIRNTTGTNVLGIDDTILRLQQMGFYVDKVQDSILAEGDYQRLQFTTVKVSIFPIKQFKFIGTLSESSFKEAKLTPVN